MKNILIFSTCILILSACSHTVDVEYTNLDTGCLYTEKETIRHSLFDYFGRRDVDLNVKYSGVKCETIVNKEVNNNVHKKPYNSIEIINEQPNLHIDIDADK